MHGRNVRIVIVLMLFAVAVAGLHVQLAVGLADNPWDKTVNSNLLGGTRETSRSGKSSAPVAESERETMNVGIYEAAVPTSAPPSFTIVALPDTQYYSQDYPWIFDNQTQWVVDNVGSMNIAFVSQEGDIVNTCTDLSQWNNANHSLSMLDNHVPWGVLPGYNDGVIAGNLANYNSYFGYNRFNGESWYGGAYLNTNTNSFQLFSEGEDQYLIFHLQYNPSNRALQWAGTTIDNNPGRRVIVVTHDYLNVDGTRTTIGANIWQRLIQPRAAQIFLVLCAGQHGEASKIDIVNDHPVYQLLANYQTRPNGGNGWLRMYQFHPTEDKIYVKTYSPYLDNFETDSDSQFALDYDMTSPSYTLTVNVTPTGSGAVSRNNTEPYQYGDWVRLIAVANSGWAFNQWSGDASGSNSQVDILIDGDKSVTASFIETNRAPVIDSFSPSSNPTVTEGQPLQFSITCHDPDGNPLWYAWLLDGFMYADTQNWTYTPDYYSAGVHNVTLLTSDSYGAHATHQWTVTVLDVNINQAPVITYYSPADTTLEVSEGDSLAFEHVSSDPEGGQLWYAWLLDDFMQADSQNWTYTPDYYSAGVHNVTLLISDSYGAHAIQQWSLTVLDVNTNQAPTIDYYSPANLSPEVEEGGSLTFEHLSSDPEGGPLWYAWLLDNFMQTDAQNWTYTPDYFAAGTRNVTLLVSDSYGARATQQWSLTVIDVDINQAPTITYYWPVNITPEVNEGGSLVFEQVPYDPEGGFLWYAWLLDNFMQSDSQNWTYTPDNYSAGTHNVTLLVSDAYGAHATQQWTVTVLDVDINQAPIITYYSPETTTPEVDEGSSLAFEHMSYDPEGGQLWYAWLLDNFMQTDAQNWIYAPDYFAAGVHNVTLLISDSYGAHATQQWSVTALDVNRAPAIDTFNPLTDPTILEGQQQEFNITCSDQDGDILTVQWYLEDAPISTGDFYVFVADFGSSGVYNVTVVVSDGLAQVSYQWSLAVLDVNRPPIIDYYAPVDTTPEVLEGGALQFEHLSSDPDGDPLSCSWLLDSVLQADTQNWTYSPGYEAQGTYNVTLVVYDLGGLFDSQQWEVSVTNVNRAPVIDSFTPVSTLPEVDEGNYLEFTHTSSDPDGDGLFYSWLLDSVEVATSQNWTYSPDYEAQGTHNVTLTVTDGEFTVSQQWEVTVLNVNRAPIIESFTPEDTVPEVNEGESLEFSHTSSDPDADALYCTWLLDSVEVSTGQNWTYTPDFEAAGVHTVTLVVSDGSLTATQQWSVTVLDVPQ